MAFFKDNRSPDKPKDDASEQAPVLTHLAVIMDGNGRWAKKRALPRRFGHRAGAENLYKLCRMAGARDIRYLTVYAFSTENWQRPSDEVEALMRLFVEFFHRYKGRIIKEGIRVRFSGDLAAMPEDVRRVIDQAEHDSMDCSKMQLIVALNYGGRREIVQAVQSLLKDVANGVLSPDAVNEEIIQEHLYLPDVPDPDLIIRPSGEQRLSNFLLWQSAYAELWFSNVLWPDFDEDDMDAALEAYASRQRRFGGIK